MEKSRITASRFDKGEMLPGFWYPTIPAARLKRGQMRRELLLKTSFLLCRDNRGKLFALDDHCPHRGMPLSFGHFDGERIECCYHGWQFDSEGRCCHIPALLPDSTIK